MDAAAGHPSTPPDEGPGGSASGPLARTWAVIPAGGAGTRLWPLSRSARPKFLADVTGTGRTLLQQTVDRVRPLVGERIVVVTGAAHAEAVTAQLPDLGDHGVLAEPAPRDSMAAIGWAAAVLERRDPDALLCSLAADHVITDPDGFRRCLAEAVAVAETGSVVTIGIRPTYAATGFGYIEAGHLVAGDLVAGTGTARTVTSFVEKPPRPRAEEYLAGGRHLWNAGMFVARASVLLDELARRHPALAAGLREIAAVPELLAERWPRLEAIAIDHAVAEPAADRGRVAVVPGDFGWTDVGDFASLTDVLAQTGGAPEGLGVLGERGLVTAVDATGLVVPHERQVAVVGLRDVVVVDTGDSVLVTSREHAQQVKQVVARLREQGREGLL